MEKTNEAKNHTESLDVMPKDESKELCLLKHSLTDIMKTKSFNVLRNPLKSSNPLVNTAGLIGIVQKLDSYKNLDEFLTDIRTLAESYAVHFAQDIRYQSIVNDFYERCSRDVKSIRKCTDCFESWINNPSDYFTNVCAQPHLIVYAKLSKFPWWPAKLMEVNHQMANVEFFGDHTQADIPLRNCILYAESHSGIKHRDNSFKIAQDELNEHIKKIRAKFGKLIPAASAVKITLDEYERHRKMMFPNAFRADDKAVSSDGPTESVEAPASTPQCDTKKVIEAPAKVEKTVQFLPIHNDANAMQMSDDHIKTAQKRQSNETTDSTMNKQKLPKIGTYVKTEFDKLTLANNELKAENEQLKRSIEALELINQKNSENIVKLKNSIVQLKRSKSAKCAFCLGLPIRDDNDDDE